MTTPGTSTSRFLVVVTALASCASLAAPEAPVVRDARDVPAALERGGDAGAWSEQTWRADVERAAGLARATHPDGEDRLRRLEGLDPVVYLARRRPEPEVARELTRLVEQDVVPAALLAQLSLRLDDGSARYPFSSAERFPKRAAVDVERLQRMEREQLRAGLLLALSSARHPSAFYLSRTSLLDEGRALPERRVAAVALGKTKDARAVALLRGVAVDEKEPLELRAAALAGLGHARSLDAVAALRELSRAPVDAALLRATALSLGQAASAWALRAVPRDDADAMRAEASSALVDLLERTADERVSSAVVDALGMVAHEGAKARLAALVDDERTPPALKQRAALAVRRLERALRRNAR